MRILYQYATRSRPDNFFRGLDSIVNNSTSDNYAINVVIDFDDTTMNNPEVISRIAQYRNTHVSIGRSVSKIDAINRLPQIKAEVVCNFSDDMIFIQKGFDEIIRQAFRDYYPNLDGVIHFNDGKQYLNCMTMSIIGRNYLTLDQYIYQPEYESLWCDLEAQEVARIRGKYQYMGDSLVIFNHLHPSFGLGDWDDQYRKTEAHGVRSSDEQVYIRRKANNYYL